MKSLTIFLISMVMFSCLVKSSVLDTAAEKPKKEDNTKKSPIPAKRAAASPAKKETKAVVPQRKSPLDLSDTDKLVCGSGQYLGNLSNGQRCRSLHLTKCKEMVQRDKNAPVTKTAAERISSLSTDNVIRKRQIKKWKLKTRAKRTAAAKAKAGKKTQPKLPSRIRKQIRIRRAAERFLNKMLSRKNKDLSKKNVDKIAKSLGKSKFPNDSIKKRKIQKMLKSAQAKRLISQKKNDRYALARIIQNNPSQAVNLKNDSTFQTGNYCVHSVVWNINYCCFFSQKNEAQEFANSQPKEELFTQLIEQGRMAEKKDKERRAKKKAANIKRVLNKVDAKAAAKRKKVQGQQTKKSSKKGSKSAAKKSIKSAIKTH